jgi:hypothetical protein
MTSPASKEGDPIPSIKSVTAMVKGRGEAALLQQVILTRTQMKKVEE